MRRSRTTSPTRATDPKRTLRIWPLAAGLIAVAIAVAWWESARDHEDTAITEASSEDAPSSAERPETYELTETERTAIATITDADGFELGTARGRMRFLEELAAWLRAQGETDIRGALARILHAAFPDEAQSLMTLWGARERYEAWMREHRAELAGLPADERRARLWAARREMFGDEADELFEAFARNEAIADALTQIDAQPTGTVQERFDRYVDAIEEQYGDAAPALMAARRQELVDRFVGLPSVQSELAAMSPEDRYAELRELRSSSGMDEAALSRWDALDRERDTRWDRGAQYMSERAAAVSSLDGEALERRLEDLRRQYFGAEADEIASEEAAGFFRFDRPREYGRN